MNNLILTKIQEYELSKSKSEKVLKVSHAIEFILIFYATLFYAETKKKGLVSREIVEIIQTKFRAPRKTSF